tara:strand:+ start:37512 stop:39695 length:2184 start_codon:yes stop_codon:yes gene_type:complete
MEVGLFFQQLHWLYRGGNKFTLKTLSRLLISFLFLSFLSFSAFSGGLIISPPKAAIPFIESSFPNADRITDKKGEPLIRMVYQGDELLGYAFETNDVARIPAYSGEPVNTLVSMNTQGQVISVNVLEHHEPILLVGIPEQKLFDFTDQYQGVQVGSKVKVGSGHQESVKYLDGISGATVTVMVVNMGIMRAATKVAIAQGIIEADEEASMLPAKVNHDVYDKADWLALTGNGAIRRLKLTNEDVDKAFSGSDAEDQSAVSDADKAEIFTDIYYTLLDIPTIGKNLLGESEYKWMMEQLKPGEHVIALMGNGYSFKGSGYVRGGIFDRVIIHQGDLEFNFRDVDQYRINDLFAENTPHFSEMSLFIVRDSYQFNVGQEWQLELLVRRQTGPVESVFTSFKADYTPLEKYLIIPSQPVVEEELSLWQQVWQERSVETSIVVISMLILTVVLFLQDWLVTFPVFMHRFRLIFLLFTVVFIGWVFKGQLSVVNVLTFVQSLMKDFNWEIFLLDPVIFVLWCFVAVAILLWGRGVYCGWLCPFGALQEILGEIAMKLKLPQLNIPYAIHERLWAIKYIILLALFGLSLESLAVAEHYAEVEPFKTTFLLRFDRDWPFILYAVGLLVVSLFNRKTYCRYICPLGAAIAVPSAVRLFDWLKRRKECGKPCQVCAVECEIGAITPTGEINMRECHYCLDCQMTYHNKEKCPPLIKKYGKRTKAAPIDASKIIAKS